MTTVLIAVVALLVGGLVGFFVRRSFVESRTAQAHETAERIIADATKQAETAKKEALVEAKDQVFQMRAEAEQEVKERRKELTATENRLIQREESIERRAESIEKREHQLSSAQGQLEKREKDARDCWRRSIVPASRSSPGMTRDEAKDVLLGKVEEEVRHDAAVLIREVEARAREEADKKARNIVGIAIQRVAADHSAESTVSVIHIPSDDLKGRIIGREGRNIRAFEQMTGINLIIDDTPEAVVLSSFDPVRREVGRVTLETPDRRRAHPPRAHRGDVQQGRHARGPAGRRGRRAGRLRDRRPRAARASSSARSAGCGSAPRTARTCSSTRSRSRYLAGVMASELGVDVKLAQARRSAARPRQGDRPRGRGPARAHRRRPRPPARRAQGDRALHRGAPRRRGGRDRRGGARAGRGRHLRRAARALAARRSRATSSASRSSRRSP